MRGWLLAVLQEPIVAAAFLALCSFTAMLLVACAEWEPSPRARRWLEDIHEILRKRGMLKAGAIDMGVTPERISRWLHPRQPNILTRLADLGDEFERDLIAARAQEVGIVVVDARLAAALEIVDAHQRRMLRAQMKETA